MRRLTNFQQLFELLAVEAARAARPLGDIARRLAGLVAKLTVPEPEEGNTLRAEGDRDAVQIMTMHRAKGLEADVVFVYGGFGPAPNDKVRSYVVDGRRRRLAGRPRLQAITDLIKDDRDGEDQRLYYVALTRARKRLYLPYSGKVPEGDASPFDPPAREEYWKLVGGYRHVNRRLRELVNEPDTRRLLDPHEIEIDARADDGARPAPTAAAFAAWQPDPGAVAPIEPDPALAELRRARAGAVTTSYSRIKQAHGGYRPPTEMLDEIAAPADAPSTRATASCRAARPPASSCTRCWRSCRCASVRESPPSTPGARAPTCAPSSSRCCAGTDAMPDELRPALRLAHAALTAPLPVVGGALAGLPHAAKTVREMEFLFPFPPEAGGPARGFVKGFVDFIFEHEGRSYFGDWKTDRLPAWDAAAVAAHVGDNYALQEQLYSLALVRMLGITDAATYEARFGGTLYVFVRGLGHSPEAVRSRRPSFDEIAALATRPGRHAGTGRSVMTAAADAYAWPPVWARDLVPATADVDRAALYLAIEAGSWPSRPRWRPPSAARSRWSCSRRSIPAAAGRHASISRRSATASRGSASRATTARPPRGWPRRGSPSRRSRPSSGSPATTGRSSSTAASCTTSATSGWNSASPARSPRAWMAPDAAPAASTAGSRDGGPRNRSRRSTPRAGGRSRSSPAGPAPARPR